jgi:hypothetical protein
MSRRWANASGVVAVVALVALGAWALARGTATQPTLTPTASAAEGLRAEANDPAGPYRLTFEFPKSTWAAGEPITARAELSYLLVGQTKLYGSGGGSLVVFGLDELNGNRDMQPVRTADCAPYVINSVQPLSTGLTKSGAFDSSDPNGAFWQAWFADRSGYRLPAGDWAITANVSFDVGECALPEHHLNATLQIHVTD